MRLPDQGADVTEVAVPWWLLTRGACQPFVGAMAGDAHLFARRRITGLG